MDTAQHDSDAEVERQSPVVDDSADAVASGSDVVELEALRRRVEALEQSVQSAGGRVAPIASVAPVAGASVEAPGRDTIRRRREISVPLPLPNYLAQTLVRGEEALLSYDAAARSGDADQAAHWAEQTAAYACLGMRRLVDEYEFESLGPESQIDLLVGLRSVTPTDGWGAEFDEFRTKEIALLRLLGLSDELATRHFADLSHLYRAARPTEDSPMDRLERAQRAVCALHDSLLAARRQREQRAQRRKKLKLSLTVLAGGTLAIGNLAATPILGPIPAAASAWLGSGAAGAVVNLLND